MREITVRVWNAEGVAFDPSAEKLEDQCNMMEDYLYDEPDSDSRTCDSPDVIVICNATKDTMLLVNNLFEKSYVFDDDLWEVHTVISGDTPGIIVLIMNRALVEMKVKDISEGVNTATFIEAEIVKTRREVFSFMCVNSREEQNSAEALGFLNKIREMADEYDASVVCGVMQCDHNTVSDAFAEYKTTYYVGDNTRFSDPPARTEFLMVSRNSVIRNTMRSFPAAMVMLKTRYGHAGWHIPIQNSILKLKESEYDCDPEARLLLDVEVYDV